MTCYYYGYYTVIVKPYSPLFVRGGVCAFFLLGLLLLMPVLACETWNNFVIEWKMGVDNKIKSAQRKLSIMAAISRRNCWTVKKKNMFEP